MVFPNFRSAFRHDLANRGGCSGRGIFPRFLDGPLVDGVNGLRKQVPETGDPANPARLLPHGFPEPAHSWRMVSDPLIRLNYVAGPPALRQTGR
jgi:hypothetical protein